MNLVILGNNNQNCLFVYKLSKLTKNNFNFQQLNQSRLQFNIDLKNENDQCRMNIYVNYNNVSTTKNCYIIIISEMNELNYSDTTRKILDDLINVDPEYKFVIFINDVEVNKYKMENKNAYIFQMIQHFGVEKIKNTLNEIIFPCVMASHTKLHSITAQLTNDEHFEKIYEIIKNTIINNF